MNHTVKSQNMTETSQRKMHFMTDAVDTQQNIHILNILHLLCERVCVLMLMIYFLLSAGCVQMTVWYSECCYMALTNVCLQCK